MKTPAEGTRKRSSSKTAARGQVERELLRKNRALSALRACNQTLIHASDEEALLNEICRVSVEVAGYRMAWVGRPEDDKEKTIRPVAQFGFEQGYLETAGVTWADAERGRGPTGTAVRTRQAVIARNLATDPDYQAWRDAAIKRGYASSIALPLVSRDAILGVLSIYSTDVDAFNQEETELLAELAGNIAYGILSLRTRQERRQAEAILRSRYKELAAIYESSQRLQKLFSPEQLAQEIIEVLERSMDYTYSAVLLVDPSAGTLEPFALSDQKKGQAFIPADKEYIRSKQVRVGTGITGWVAAHGKNLRLGDVRADPRYLPMREEILSEMCVPLWMQDRVIGVVNVESTRLDAYTEDDEQLLETIATQISVAIQNSKLLAELRLNHNRMADLSRQLVQAQELERRDLARELHDRVGQSLTALNINLSIVQSQLSVDSAKKIGSRIADSIVLVDETVARVRDVMADLYPPVLADYGLGAALRWYGEKFTHRTEIPVSLDDATDPATRLPSHLEAVLFRVAQEALNNIARHSRAMQVQVRLERSGRAMRLRITDDGLGFDPAAVTRSERGGWGLQTMRERVEAVGGGFRIVSRPGGGTIIEVEILPDETGGQ